MNMIDTIDIPNLQKFISNYYERENHRQIDINITPIINQWKRNKADIFHLFGDKTRIIIPTEYKPTDSMLYDEFYNFCYYNFIIRQSAEYCISFGNFEVRNQFYWGANFKHSTKIDALKKLVNFSTDDFISMLLNYSTSKTSDMIRNNNITKDFYNHALNYYDKDTFYTKNDYNAFVSIVAKYVIPNMKLSKFISNITNPVKRDEANIAYSQITNGINLKGNLVLSIDPIDYLTMSDNMSRWSSCHSLGSFHRGGCLSYLIDSTTIITYFTTKNKMLCVYNGKEKGFVSTTDNDKGVYITDKKWRMCLDINLSAKTFATSAHYPYDNDDFEKIIVDSIANLMGYKGKDYVETRFPYCRQTKSGHYDDLSTKGTQYFTKDMRKEFSENKDKYLIHYGARWSCPICGTRKVGAGGRFTCLTCAKKGVIG